MLLTAESSTASGCSAEDGGAHDHEPHARSEPGGHSGALAPGAEWGLGFKITTTSELQLPGSVGMYGWVGTYGTNFGSIPEEKLIGIIMVQRYPGATAAAPFQ